MRRVVCSPWLVSGVSLAVGVGVGAALTWNSSSSSSSSFTSSSLLHRLPIIPIPTVSARSEVIPYPQGPLTPSKPTQAMKYGFPSLSNIKSRESYVTSYDPRTRTAAWVIEQLTPESLTGSSDRRLCDFKEDETVHFYHRATNGDYKGSGFDRGHLAAAANHKWSQRAMEDTFYLSNVAPQVALPELTSAGGPQLQDC